MGGPGWFLLASLSLHRRHDTGHGHNIFILPEGAGSGAVQHPSPRPDMQHPHAGTATQARARLGQGLGLWNIHSSPARMLGLWALLPPLEQGDRGLGCFPVAGTLLFWPGRKTAQGVWSLASLRHSFWYRVGTALPTGRAWPDTQDSAAYILSSPQQG